MSAALPVYPNFVVNWTEDSKSKKSQVLIHINSDTSIYRILLAAIWHHGLTKAQAESLEAIQRRALRIIDSSTTVGMPYQVALSLTQFASLHDRRERLNKKNFSSITLPLFLYLRPAPTTQRLHHHLQITYSIPIPPTRNPH